MLENQDFDYGKMAEAAAAWWADRLDPVNGWDARGVLDNTLAQDEIENFKHVLEAMIRELLESLPDPVASLWLRSLKVEGMNHTGLLAEVAEAVGLTGIIYHLPRTTMSIDVEAGQILVENQVVWDYRQVLAV